MSVLYLLLLLLALVCFVVAASGRVVTKLNVVALGLFFWVLVPFLETLTSL